MTWFWILAALGLLIGGGGYALTHTDRMKGPRWDHLHPDLKRRIVALLARAQAGGLRVMFWDGWRTEALQRSYMSKGTSFVSDPLHSFHPWGLAADLVFVGSLGQPLWPPSSDPRWQTLGAMGEAEGLSWGGRWKNVDSPHFQLKGQSPANLLSRFGRDPLAYLEAQGPIAVSA